MSTTEILHQPDIPPFDPVEAEEQLWHEERRKGVGGSDVHHLFPSLNLEDKSDPGSRYGCPRLLWYEKMNIKPDFEHTPEALRLFDRGHAMEEYAAQRYMEKTGVRVFRSAKPYVSPLYPFMRCNLDRRIKIGQDGVRKALECKSVNEHAAVKMDMEGLPIGYSLQVQHTNAVGQFDATDFAVIIVPDYVDAVIEQIEEGSLRSRILNLLAPRFDFLSFECKRDESLMGMIVEKESEFWGMVEKKTPPDPLPNLNDKRCGGCLYRKTCRGPMFAQANDGIPVRDKKTGIEYQPVTNPEFVQIATDRLAAMKTQDDIEETLKAINLELQQNWPAGASAVEIPGSGVKIRWGWQRGAERWDADGLKADSNTIGRKLGFADWATEKHPEIFAEYVQGDNPHPPSLADQYKKRGAPSRPFVFDVRGMDKETA